MEYDLLRICDHPLMMDDYLAPAIIVFGGLEVAEYQLEVRWRIAASAAELTDTLVIRWNLDRLEKKVPNLRRKIENMLERDHARWRHIEDAAVVVTAAVLANIVPGTVYSERAEIGTFHDFYLNNTADEMVEIAGRGSSKMGLDCLFLEEKAQSDQNKNLQKRWVSVTVFSSRPRNRTEGLHP